jgi:ATP-dependent 26S proteasome regulatory subunit
LEHTAPDVFLRTATGGFILVEEVDALPIACMDSPDDKAAPVDSSKSVSRQLLWQWLSGGIPHSGSVIFLTTNHKDKLHPALLRDSRVDRDVYIGNWHAAEVQQFLRQHCADLNVKPAWLGALDKLSDFPGALADTEFPSGASIKQLLSETPINDVLSA